ncbi:MAG: fatty-acid oxidation protein subunit alpha [Bacteroidetes bacterium]|jgi:hypothetical protein|nr:fatty-acid oxidation protein subunit alpha [Bacteroidota bacterium]
MSAKDKYHEDVRIALQKANWIITHDPYFLRLEGVNFPVDLGAEKMLAAEKANQKILVEVKSFISESIPNEFHTALGQYLDYETGLEEYDPQRELFLAVPKTAFNKIKEIPILMTVLRKYKVNIIVFDPFEKTLQQWIKNQ